MSRQGLKHYTLESAENVGLLSLAQRIGRGSGQALYVLAYHRVERRRGGHTLDPDLVSTTPELLEAQMELLARQYHPVSAEEVVRAASGGERLAADAVLVTVDDGYRDFQELIFPIARRYGIRPVLFVPTGYVGTGGFWWDRLYEALYHTTGAEVETPVGRLPLQTQVEKYAAMGRLRAYVEQAPFEQALLEINELCATLAPPPAGPPNGKHTTLAWNELRALARGGATIAAHTQTHPILSHVSLEQARREIRESQAVIRREIGEALPVFAYPNGRRQAIGPELEQVLKEEGFQLAFTMVEGRAQLKEDELLRLPRLAVSTHLSLAQFHMHLTPWYDYWKGGGRDS